MSTHEQFLSRSRFSRRSLLIGGGAAALTLAAPRSITAAYPGEPAYAHAEMLIDAATLMQQLDSVSVIALTPIADFETGHIPGAAQIDWPDLLVGRTTRPSIENWQSRLQEHLAQLGVTPGKPVVVYDGGTFLAPRVWWALDSLGHTDARILNGGIAAWKAANGPIETGPSLAQAMDVYPGSINFATFATQGEVMKAINDPSVVLLDGRDPTEFAAGRIPGAINYHFLNNAEGGPVKVMKGADVLTAAYTGLGVTPDKEIVAYCTTGVRACGNFYTLRLLGYPAVRVYAGSWDEWKAVPYFPIETGH